MGDKIVVRRPARDDVAMAARMTSTQFNALARRLERESLVVALKQHALHMRPKRGRACVIDEVEKWLLNGWNTELLLRTNRASLQGDALRHSLHWAFPQAYYSVFALTLAYFKTVGYSEESHASVIRKFGAEAASAKYPAPLCALADGAPPATSGLASKQLRHALEYDLSDSESVDAQVAQFLRATRKIDLAERKRSIRIETKAGTRKKSFKAEDWSRVSSSLGHTSLLSLLYRKRLKANYRDIDTFLHEELDVESIYVDLVKVVGALNFVHEVFIAQALGAHVVQNAQKTLPRGNGGGPFARLKRLAELAA